MLSVLLASLATEQLLKPLVLELLIQLVEQIPVPPALKVIHVPLPHLRQQSAPKVNTQLQAVPRALLAEPETTATTEEPLHRLDALLVSIQTSPKTEFANPARQDTNVLQIRLQRVLQENTPLASQLTARPVE